MINPVLTALTQARLRAAPMFARWCELNSVPFCPAAPRAVERFVRDCSALGIERLWPTIQEISRLHVGLGLADPTLGGIAASAIADIAAVAPPRSWPGDQRQRFRSLPYDIQLFISMHESQREKALRRAQNEAASARQKLAKFEDYGKEAAEGDRAHEDTARDS